MKTVRSGRISTSFSKQECHSCKGSCTSVPLWPFSAWGGLRLCVLSSSQWIPGDQVLTIFNWFCHLWISTLTRVVYGMITYLSKYCLILIVEMKHSMRKRFQKINKWHSHLSYLKPYLFYGDDSKRPRFFTSPSDHFSINLSWYLRVSFYLVTGLFSFSSQAFSPW